MKPTVGRIVHYVSRGSADGVFPPKCRTATVSEVNEEGRVGLVVLNPDGLFFHSLGHAAGPCPYSEDTKVGGTWHWPEREDNRTLGEVLSDPTDTRASWPEAGTQ